MCNGQRSIHFYILKKQLDSKLGVSSIVLHLQKMAKPAKKKIAHNTRT